MMFIYSFPQTEVTLLHCSLINILAENPTDITENKILKRYIITQRNEIIGQELREACFATLPSLGVPCVDVYIHMPK